MLDTIRTLMAEALGVTVKEVNDLREALLQEQATEDARYAATSALLHPKGSTTPIKEAYSSSQVTVDRMRDRAVKEIPKALALILATEVAVQRRDEAKVHLDLKGEDKAFRKETGLHVAAADWFTRLAKHGVHPNYLKQHMNETVAIIADLITWKAKDAKFDDPDNPWRAVLGVYAGRVIEKPDKVGTTKRSKTGIPKGPRHRGGSEDYRFDRMVLPSWGDVAAPFENEPDHDGAVQDKSTAPPSGQDLSQSDPTTFTAARVADTDQLLPEPAIDYLPTKPAMPSAFRDAAPPPPITPAQAMEMAEKIHQNEPARLNLFWPIEVAVHDYTPERLIPALESWVARGAWSGVREFLDAARLGQAREYTAGMQHLLVESLAANLVERKPEAIEAARRAGFLV